MLFLCIKKNVFNFGILKFCFPDIYIQCEPIRSKSSFETGVSKIEMLLCAFSILLPLYFGYKNTAFLIAVPWRLKFKCIKLNIAMLMVVVDAFLPGSGGLFLGKNNVFIFVHFPILFSLNSLNHLWYHTPQSARREYFPLTYSFFNACESMNIISTEHHKKHHEHRLDNAEDVKVWVELPQFAIEDYLEKMCHKMWNNGETNIMKLTLLHLGLHVAVIPILHLIT